ncbi:Nn.00g050920.m01.CDS01 [Neocucurbitaria sp. VM-36]
MASDIRNLNLCCNDSTTTIEEHAYIEAMHGLRGGKGALDLRVLGIRTGSGLNELDYALVHYRQDTPNVPLQVEVLKFCEIPIPSVTRNRILDLLHRVPRKPRIILRLNALLGHMFSKGIKNFCRRHNIALTSIDLVGTHTPTLQRLHLSDNAKTHKLGWNATIRAETGITAVSHFFIVECGVARRLTPPIAFVDRLLLRHSTKFRVCLNIDELANITFIPPVVDDSPRLTISHICGPGSLFIDYAIRYCTSNDHREDHNGKFGSEGKISEEVVDRFIKSQDYLRASPPLSMAQEMFGDHEAQRLIDECIYLYISDADIIATITRITAHNILKQYLRLLQLYFPPGQHVDELFVCGRSARNMNIVDYLEANLPESVVTKPLEDLGIPGDAKESFCYAHLALETVLGQATQSASPHSPATPTPMEEGFVEGQIIRGIEWKDLLVRIDEFSEGKPLHATRNFEVVPKLQTVIQTREPLTTRN